jgi:molecular chaperone DnaJ
MSAVNEAYRVLSDPARRVVYDRSLDDGRTIGPSGSARPSEPEFDREPSRAPRQTPLSPSGPARVPWKLMSIVALIGSSLVLVSSFFDDPPGVRPPDGILEIGSCVAFEPNGDAREIACTGTDADVVVKSLVPLDGTCPVGMSQHRGRLGMVVVCIERTR